MTLAQPDGFHTNPTTSNNPVLVLHAWWGLNDTMKAFCMRLAKSGFNVFAPDLYHGKVTDSVAEAEILSDSLEIDRARADLADSIMFLNEHSRETHAGFAVVGFSLGAYFALDLSITDPEHIHSVVMFYGTGPVDYSSSRAAYLGHFAENDKFEPQSNIDELDAALRRADRPVNFYTYPGTGHWFFESDRPEAYNQEAANLAWERTINFLKRSL